MSFLCPGRRDRIQCCKVSSLPEIKESYNIDSCYTVNIAGPHPQGTKSLFFNIKPVIVGNFDNLNYDMYPGRCNRDTPQFVKQLLAIRGAVELKFYGNHMGHFEVNLNRYHDREEVVKDIMCILYTNGIIGNTVHYTRPCNCYSKRPPCVKVDTCCPRSCDPRDYCKPCKNYRPR